MKSVKKYLVLMLSLTLLFLVGCGDSKDGPDKSAKALYNLYILQDSTDYEKLGFSKTEAQTMIKNRKITEKVLTKKIMEESGLIIDDNQLELLYNAQEKLMKKLSSDIEVVSIEDDTAKVKISTTYADLVAAAIETGEDTQSEVKVNGISDPNKIITIYFNKIIDKVNAMEPSIAKREFIFDFKKDKFEVNGEYKEIWQPKDVAEFGDKIGKMASGE